MPFNASGVFQRLFNWRNDRDAGIKILAERMDQEMDGIAAAINSVLAGEIARKGPIKNVYGTAANPAYTFADDTGGGLFHKPDGSIGVSVGGVEVGAFPASFFTGITGHHAATNNPHGVTAAQTGAYTQAQTDSAIAAHTGRTDNPHGVTAAQVLAPGNMFLDKSGLSFAGFMECDGSSYDAGVYPSLAALGYTSTSNADTIALGADGKLILPATVGADVYYYWDFDGSGAPSDTATLDSLKSRFTGGADFSGSEPQITLNGVDIVLPEIGAASPTDGGLLTKGGSYTGLAALWGAHTDASGLGGVAGWPVSYYCSSSPFSTTGAWRLQFNSSPTYAGTTSGTTLGTQNSHVAVRVPNPPRVTNYVLPDSATGLGAPAGYSYYLKY